MPVTTNAMVKENDYFISPFRMILSGSSGAGKTHFAGDLIRARLFESEIEFVLPAPLDPLKIILNGDMK